MSHEESLFASIARKDDDVRRTIDDAPQAFTKSFCPEIHQQPYRLPGQLDVGQQLLAMHRRNPLHRLDFDDQLAVDEKVDTISFIESQAVEFDRKKLLPFD